jgi:fibronectin type III domain protein
MIAFRLPLLLTILLLPVHAVYAGGCGAPIPRYIGAANLPHAVNLDNGTDAQPLGGELHFVVPTEVLTQPKAKLVACLRWRPRDDQAATELRDVATNAKSSNVDGWTDDLPLRVIDRQSDLTTVSIRLPLQIAPFKGNAWPDSRHYAYFGLWPLVDFRVRATGADDVATLDEIIPIGISSLPISGAITITAVVLFWAVMYAIARRRGVRGGILLKVISNRYGYASLSQFQIMLWTMVIGAAAIYVMVLSGRLLDIPTPTLALLGIAGVAAVAAKLQKAGDPGDQAAGAKPIAAWPPGAVTELRVVGPPGSLSAVLSWSAPEGGGTPSHYEVQYRSPPGAGNWTGAPGGGAVRQAPFRVTGLAAATQYEFQIIAVNTGGSGPSTPCGPVITAAAPAAPPAEPARVEGLSPPPDGGAHNDRIELRWNALAPAPEGYVVRFRRAGESNWIVAGVTDALTTMLEVGGLTPDTDHEFQVIAVAAGLDGPASALATGRTAPVLREPKLGDLLVWDGTSEIDVTRLQMLFFTLVSAVFVSLKVISQNEIPTIPDGILLLMGLSNGVYLTAKFVPGER